jgi:hypothetical protein
MASKLYDLLPAIIAANDAALKVAAIRTMFIGTSGAKGRKIELEEKLASLVPEGAIWGASPIRPLDRDGGQSGAATRLPVRYKTPLEGGFGKEGDGPGEIFMPAATEIARQTVSAANHSITPDRLPP